MIQIIFFYVESKSYKICDNMKEKNFHGNQSPLIELFLSHHEVLLVHCQESKGKTWCHIVLTKKQVSTNLTTH